MPRIGLYPGTFDPIHSGHIAFAQAALAQCSLDEVIFIPEHTPWRKQTVTSLHHRYALIEKAIQGLPGLRVMQLDTKQFTVEKTLPELKRLFNDASLTLLMGSDVAKGLHHWEGLSELLQQVSLAIGLRGDDTAETIAALLPPQANYDLVQTEQGHIASSQVRKGSRASDLPAAAQAYIQEHKLY